MIEFSHVSFTYSGSDTPALSDLCFHVGKGEFVLVCGPSGCGKTTLLRLIKPQLRPFGKQSGEVRFNGTDPVSMSGRDQAAKIGFVQQSPENQIVTDKVWHELAFAMESLGYETDAIRKKVTEMTEFFGIGSWFRKNVSELSGGQKQLLNLAAIMTLDPEILILDEPTAQLDPVAAEGFLSMLGKINRELGITVLLSEHRMEEAIPLSDRMCVMDRGRIVFEGLPREAGRLLAGSGRAASFMTAPMRLWGTLEEKKKKDSCPVSVREGRNWLSGFTVGRCPRRLYRPETPKEREKQVILHADEVFFRYEKGGPDIVNGLKLKLYKGEFAVLLGGNGTGKTTAMKLLAGLYVPRHGTIECGLRRAMLPQDPGTLFARKTVREELEEMNDSADAVDAMLKRLRLEELPGRNPFDLSGGEQQRLALGKLLLTEPDLLLLDEPTKGLDAELKEELACILRKLTAAGKSVLMISHDVEFAAEYADRCMMLFDGAVVAGGTPSSFFQGNRFYTTAVCRMTGGILEGTVTEKDVLEVFGRKDTETELQQEIPPEIYAAETEGTQPATSTVMPTGTAFLPAEGVKGGAAETAPEIGKNKWNIRKIPAILSGCCAACFMGGIISRNRLSDYITNGQLTDHALTNVGLYVGLIVSFVCLILFLYKKKPEEDRSAAGVIPPVGKASPERLTGRTKLSLFLLLLAAPATIFLGTSVPGGDGYYLISLLLLAECMIPFAIEWEGRKPKARELALLAVMTAVAIVGRTAFFAVPGFSPIFGIVMLAGIAFGAESGFLVGSLSMLLSNFLFGQGPWTPWQMFSMGLVGFLAGILFRRGRLERKRGLMASIGAALSVLVYGGIMNPASALMADRTGRASSILVYYFTGLPVDLVHGAATFVVLWFFGEEFLYRIERVKIKYGLNER